MAAASVIASYMIPTGIVSPATGASIVSLSKDWAKQALTHYMRFSNFNSNNNRTEHHRSQYDAVSLLASYNKNTFTYPSKGSFYDILNNHEMEHLMNTVLNSTNSTTFIEELSEDSVKSVIREVTNDITQRFYNLKQAPHFPVDVLGRKNIFSTRALIAGSRWNFKKNISNPFLVS
jgi:hypothetical protein